MNERSEKRTTERKGKNVKGNGKSAEKKKQSRERERERERYSWHFTNLRTKIPLYK